MKIRIYYLSIIVVAVLVSACAASTQQPEQVVVAPLGSGDVTSSGMTRAELEDHVRRFSDRYYTRIALATNNVQDQTASVQIWRLMHDWKTVSSTAVIEIAIGPDGVTNLLDMMTLTRLSRLVVEDYWVPEVLGDELGTDFQKVFVDLENDIWGVADDVLTEQHQKELRFLIDEWHAENPEQYYPWYVRLSNFSGQRAASLAAVQQSGGLLKDVARATDAAEEIQAFGERVLFYLQRAPMLTTNEFESTANSLLGGPEISGLVADTRRFVAAMELFVETIDDLPDDRITAVDQLMDRISDERKDLFSSMVGAEPGLRAVLADLLPVLESLERTVVVAKTRNPDSVPFNINEYTEIVAEAAVTAGELRLLLQSVSELVNDSQNGLPLVDAIVAAENSVVDRFVLQMAALIVFFFVMLLIYRVIAKRMFPKHS
jgi:hypothetical protein